MVEEINSSNIFPVEQQQELLGAQQPVEELDSIAQLQEAIASPEPQEDLSLTAGEITEFSQELRETFVALQESAEPFLDQSPLAEPVWEERTVELSDPEVAEIEVEEGVEPQSGEIIVEELAQAQEMVGAPMAADDPAEISPGEYEFALEQGEMAETIELEVGEEDTPIEVLEEVAGEIEATELEVEADVIITADDEVALEVRAAAEGLAGEFELIDETGDFLTEEVELAIAQEAAPALVEMEGFLAEDIEQEGNIIALNQGEIELELRATGETEVEVAVDSAAVESTLEEFIGAIEDVEQFLTDQPVSPNLVDRAADLEATLEENLVELEELGIEVGPEGEVEIEDDIFQPAMAEEPAALEEIFTGEGLRPGAALEAEGVADDALTRPLSDLIAPEELEEEGLEMTSPVDWQIYNQQGQMSSLIAIDQGQLLNILM